MFHLLVQQEYGVLTTVRAHWEALTFPDPEVVL